MKNVSLDFLDIGDERTMMDLQKIIRIIGTPTEGR